MPSYAVDLTQWQVQDRVWGYVDTQTHGGVIDDNVAFDDEGNLILMANGDWYVGDKQGIVDTPNITVTGGQRTGAAITSSQTYGPGSFEVSMKIPAFNGICSSVWLFNYVENGEGMEDDNYEIDIEVHGTTIGDGNLSRPLFSTWLTQANHTSTYQDVGYNLADGKFHTYRIDWHTGDSPYVEYYIDGVLMMTYTEKVPTNEMYFNIGCWFPKDWCGEPDFETDYMVVKSFSYTPFEGETAGKVNTATKLPGGWLSGIEIPVKNLVANGTFAYDITANNAWTVTDGGTATVANGDLTLNGTLTQNVYMDCLGLSYNLLVQGSGNATVKVTYLSLADGSELGSVEGALGETLRLTTPANCTQLKIEIISSGEVTLNEVSLLLNVTN